MEKDSPPSSCPRCDSDNIQLVELARKLGSSTSETRGGGVGVGVGSGGVGAGAGIGKSKTRTKSELAADLGPPKDRQDTYVEFIKVSAIIAMVFSVIVSVIWRDTPAFPVFIISFIVIWPVLRVLNSLSLKAEAEKRGRDSKLQKAKYDYSYICLKCGHKFLDQNGFDRAKSRVDEKHPLVVESDGAEIGGNKRSSRKKAEETNATKLVAKAGESEVVEGVKVGAKFSTCPKCSFHKAEPFDVCPSCGVVGWKVATKQG